MQPPVIIYRISRFFYDLKIKPISWLFDYSNRLFFKCWIPGSARIGKNFTVGYWGIGVIIHSNTIIGDNCQVNQNTTIGKKITTNGVPKLGNNVYIGANCVIYGAISIGDHAVIGPLSLVNTNIPANTFAAGVPAKPIKENSSSKDT